MKKIACYKCRYRFKDREDPTDIGINKQLCWNCRHIWQVIGMVLQTFEYNPFMPKKLNRDVRIDIDAISIRRRKNIISPFK